MRPLQFSTLIFLGLAVSGGRVCTFAQAPDWFRSQETDWFTAKDKNGDGAISENEVDEHQWEVLKEELGLVPAFKTRDGKYHFITSTYVRLNLPSLMTGGTIGS